MQIGQCCVRNGIVNKVKKPGDLSILGVDRNDGKSNSCQSEI